MLTDVSVVIPARNSALHLAETVASVQAQTVAVESIIIVDDGSTDDTANIAIRFGGKVKYIRQEQAGAAQARNCGVQHVETGYLAFLDSDDLWMPQKLEWQVAELANCEQPAMIYGHAVQFASPELSAAEVAQLKFSTAPMPAICASALLMRTAEFRRAGVFNAALATGEFIEWYARAQALGIATRMLAPTVFHRRLHRGNHGRSQTRAHYARALKGVLDSRRRPS